MPTDKEIHDALMVIDSRLGTIEGKVNLVARADREALLAVLEKTVRSAPMIGRIYLLLDGARTQDTIINDLARNGTPSSKPAVSRYLRKMSAEHGIADLVADSLGRGNVYRKNRAMEQILNLSSKVQQWLDDLK